MYKLFNTVTGISHLNDKVVEVKTDNAVHPSRTVTAGSITLQRYVTQAVVGLPYNTTITTLPTEYETGMGSMQGQRTRRPRPSIKILNSTLPKLNNNFLPNRQPSDSMDAAVTLTTGMVYFGPTYFSNSDVLTFTVDEPLPFVLLGIYGVLEGSV